MTIDERVPDEPSAVKHLRRITGEDKTTSQALVYIDTLRDLLKRESARADEMTRKYAERWNRAEAAERQLAEKERENEALRKKLSYYEAITTGAEHKAIDAAIKEQSHG